MNRLARQRRRVLTILTVLCAGLLVAALACARDSDELATSVPPPVQPLQTPTATAQPIPPSAPPTATADLSAAAASTPDPTTSAQPTDTPKLDPTPTEVEKAERVMWSMLQPGNRVNESASCIGRRRWPPGPCAGPHRSRCSNIRHNGGAGNRPRFGTDHRRTRRRGLCADRTMD